MEQHIIRLDETDSTNNFLRHYNLPADNAMGVAVARHQTAGRGQGSNTWESEPGKNLLFSVKIKPFDIPIGKQFVLSMTMAIAIKEVLDSYSAGFTLKWPNDIYWHDYKISGTLIETTVSGKSLSSCIFGIGIDVNQKLFLSDAPNPISLCSITGGDEDLDLLLNNILLSFQKYYAILLTQGTAAIVCMYNDMLYRKFGYHAYRDANGCFDAKIVRVEDTGTLVLCDTNGTTRRYAFKEVAAILPNK